MKDLITSCVVKIGLFLGLLVIVMFLFGCNKETPNVPQGEILHYEIDNPETGTWRTYTIEEDSVDLFEKWQEWQPNKLEQDKWDAYMNDEN